MPRKLGRGLHSAENNKSLLSEQGEKYRRGNRREDFSSSETIIIIPRIEGNEILLLRIPSLFLPRRYTRNLMIMLIILIREKKNYRLYRGHKR